MPLKGFDVAKERLAPLLEPTRRSALAKATADHVAMACIGGGFDLTIVTGDATVAAWAAGHGASVVTDPGEGLDAACRAGIAAGSGPWVVVHGDLPLLDPATMQRVRTALNSGTSIIAPSRDGGTNVLGAVSTISLSYGPASFHRHLAVLPAPFEVFTGVETMIELDTPADLEAAACVHAGRWLAPFGT